MVWPLISSWKLMQWLQYACSRALGCSLGSTSPHFSICTPTSVKNIHMSPALVQSRVNQLAVTGRPICCSLVVTAVMLQGTVPGLCTTRPEQRYSRSEPSLQPTRASVVSSPPVFSLPVTQYCLALASAPLWPALVQIQAPACFWGLYLQDLSSSLSWLAAAHLY